MDKLKMTSMDKVQGNIEKIKALFPNAVTEVKRNGRTELKVDFDVLKQELSNDLIDDRELRYQFTWPDKQRAVLRANTRTNKTLRPCREESVDFDNTQNLYIEGDNLEVLKLLQETYLGKIKMIYIDPPYNTGNDFVYNDDFAMSAQDYSEVSGEYDEEGNRLVLNTESNGRFHTDWLNMIYPRLRLTKDLLSDDGIIFISIDDNEVDNLRKVCDEIFGEHNFICNFVRKNKAGSGHDSAYIAIEFDYVLCYVKNIQSCTLNQEIVDTECDPKYKLSDEFEDKRGRYYLRDLDYRGSYSEALDYPIIAPDGTEIYSGGVHGRPNTWRWSKQKFDWGVRNNFIVFQQKVDKSWKVYIKQYQYVDNNNQSYIRTIPYRALIDYSNGLGSMECEELLGRGFFSYPKPSALLKHLLKIGTTKDSIILDFFSGSATTAHAVMQLNAEDGGNRKFIMVQLPEPCDEKSEAYKAGYKNICEIGKERIRRAGKKIKEENGEKAQNLDIGFRVLKLDSSNLKDIYYKPEEYSQTLLGNLQDNIKADRTPLDLLFQVMLELDKPISAKITQTVIDGKSLFNVDDGDLIACFEDNISADVVTEIAKVKPIYAVFRDSGLSSDSVAANFDQIFATYSPNTVRKVL